jgi:hypothetical protein
MSNLVEKLALTIEARIRTCEKNLKADSGEETANLIDESRILGQISAYTDILLVLTGKKK